jgi:hypothetical protein
MGLMTIDEAIKELEADFTNQHPHTPARVSQAKQFGIEALKEFKRAREQGQLSPNELLKGESKS